MENIPDFSKTSGKGWNNENIIMGILSIKYDDLGSTHQWVGDNQIFFTQMMKANCWVPE